MKPTVTILLEEYNKMNEEIGLMRKALDDKSVVVARYFGSTYHLVNVDKKVEELVMKVNQLGGFDSITPINP